MQHLEGDVETEVKDTTCNKPAEVIVASEAAWELIKATRKIHEAIRKLFEKVCYTYNGRLPRLEEVTPKYHESDRKLLYATSCRPPR